MKKFFWGIRRNFFRLLKKCKIYDKINLEENFIDNWNYNEGVITLDFIINAQDTASNISKYIIYYFNDRNKTITNLSLQKILYFLWIDYYKLTGKELFDDYFFAWRYGPVIPDIYYNYNCYGKGNIPKQDPESLIFKDNDIYAVYPKADEIETFCDKKILNTLLDKYLDVKCTTLVSQSHKEQGAWSETYNKGEGERFLITYSLIKEKMG